MPLDEKDVRHIVRLVGEVVTIPGGHGRKKRVLMEGLCQLVGADAWAWTLSCQREPDKPQVYVAFQNGGLSQANLAKVLQAIEHPDMVEIAAKFFHEIKKQNTHLTRLRFQITDRQRYEKSGAHLAWKAANIGPTILSLRPLDDRSSSVIGLYRRYDKPEFTERECRIAHILVTEVPWLHELGWPEDRGVNVPSLSKRQRLTLNLLTLGQNCKQIAAHLDISTHTAQGHIKDVYRFFQVHSQAELINRFLQGNGCDLP